VMFVMFFAIILPLPPARAPATPFGLFVVSNLRISVPWLETTIDIGVFAVVLAAGALAALGLGWWRTRRSERTGERHHRVLWATVVFVVIGVTGWMLLDRPVRGTIPRLDGRQVVGGLSGLGSYFAVLIALVLYTASHVAEIVRGSILAVPKGQTEAAYALALSGFQRLRFVILPQAMRIAIPPTINQYLNFTKNTSLAIAVGYAEVTLITFQAIGNGNPAPQLVLLLMAIYLMFSLTISAVVNFLNSRLRLETR